MVAAGIADSPVLSLNRRTENQEPLVQRPLEPLIGSSLMFLRYNGRSMLLNSDSTLSNRRDLDLWSMLRAALVEWKLAVPGVETAAAASLRAV